MKHAVNKTIAVPVALLLAHVLCCPLGAQQPQQRPGAATPRPAQEGGGFRGAPYGSGGTSPGISEGYTGTAADERAPAPDELSASLVRRALASPISVSFASAPLSEVVQFFRQMTRVNIIVDRRGLEEEGIAQDEVSITLDLENVPFSSCLSLALEQAGLDYYVVDEANAIVITTRDRAAEKLETRTYNVADFVAAADTRVLHELLKRTGIVPGRLGRGGLEMSWDDFILTDPSLGSSGGGASARAGGQEPAHGTGGFGGFSGTASTTSSSSDKADQVGPALAALVDLITSTISPETWQHAGGVGTIGTYGGTTLVVTQNRAVHDQIAELLEELRATLQLGRAVSVEVTWSLAPAAVAPAVGRAGGAPSGSGMAGGTGHSEYGIDVGSVRGMRQGAGVGFSGEEGPMGGEEAITDYRIHQGIDITMENMAFVPSVPATPQNTIARASVVLLLGQTVAFVGGRSNAVTTEAVPVVAQQAQAYQVIVREAIDGLRLQLRVLPSPRPETVLLELEFHLTARFEREGGQNPDQPERYRGSLAGGSVLVPVPLNGTYVPVATVPFDQNPQTHVTVGVRVTRMQ